jgi:hypothetical protein
MIVLFAALLLQTGRAASPAQLPVQRGWSVTPDTVTVGQPFRVVLRIRAPQGATVTFPNGPDSASTIEAVDPRQLRALVDSTGNGGVDETASYRVVAWDVGTQPLALGDVIVKVGATERRVPLTDLKVYVRSVLPADSAQRVPKPPRDIFEFGRPWWVWALIELLAAAIVGGLLWWWWKRRRRTGEPTADPLADAEAAFERVERLRLLEAGERSRYVALMVEVLRDYLARVVPAATTSLTTSELLHALREEKAVPSSRLALVLADADLVKFAARAVSSDRARDLGVEARGIVRAVDRALHPPASDAKAPEAKAA